MSFVLMFIDVHYGSIWSVKQPQKQPLMKFIVFCVPHSTTESQGTRYGLRLIQIESSSFKSEVTDGITDDKKRRKNHQGYDSST